MAGTTECAVTAEGLTPRMCAYRVHVRTQRQPNPIRTVLDVKAILCTRLGGPDALELVELPMPVAAAGEAVVSIKAVGLNFYDTLIIAGKYQTKPPLPFSPGGEFAGVIESVGEGVTGFAPGDRVLGYTSYGAARPSAAVPWGKLARLGVDLDLERAAGLNITYGTSYHALRDRAALEAGETLAV